jgi:hypothetical protein
MALKLKKPTAELDLPVSQVTILYILRLSQDAHELLVTYADAGVPLTKVYNYLVEDHGMQRKVASRASMNVHLNTFLKHPIATQVRADMAASALGSLRFENTVDPIRELTDAVHTQRMRVNKVLSQEAKMPSLLLESASKELDIFTKMSTALAKLQLEAGIIQKAPKKITGAIIDEKGQRKSFAWTEEFTHLEKELEELGIDFDDDG